MNSNECLKNVLPSSQAPYEERILAPTNDHERSLDRDFAPTMEDDTLPHSNFADESLSITDVVFDGENLLDEDFPNPPHRSFDDTGTEGGYIGDGTRMPYDENTKPASTPSRCSSGSPFSLSRIGLDYTPLRNATFEGIRSAFTLERNDEDSS